MWTHLPYLLQVQVSLALMWLFYRLALYRDIRFSFLRAYLLAAVPVAFLLPLLSIPVFPGREIVLPVALSYAPPAVGTAGEAVGGAAAAATAGYGWGFFLTLGAVVGSAVLGFVALLNVLPWLRLMRRPVHRVPAYSRLKVVYTPAVKTACAFFGRVFVNAEQLKEEHELYPVLAHEQAHIRLRHSWDLVLAEAIRILFWWNPFVWLWHRSLREVHEYQADRHVLREGYPTERYIGLMTSQFVENGPAFISGFSYSLIKKRIVMIATGKPRRLARLKALLTIPLLGVLLTLFSFTEREAVLVFPEQVKAMEPPTAESVAAEENAKETTPDTLKLSAEVREAHESVARLREDTARLHNVRRQAMAAAEELRTQAEAMAGEMTEQGREVAATAAELYRREIGRVNAELKALTEEMKGLMREIQGKEKVEPEREAPVIKIEDIEPDKRPLVIIEGVPQSDADALTRLNPKEVQSISVLKDKESIAKYGEEGKNGVIVVTTKKKEPAEEIRITAPPVEPQNGELVKIRGIGTAAGGEEPLVVVDDVWHDASILQRLNPNDIESITVLRDKESTAKYGSRGKNGVVIVTTKNAPPKAEAVIMNDSEDQGDAESSNQPDADEVESIAVHKDIETLSSYGRRGGNSAVLVTTEQKAKEWGVIPDAGAEQDMEPSEILNETESDDVEIDWFVTSVDPLLIVDGVRQASASVLNQMDSDVIESIKIIKDIHILKRYGPKGMNGVVLVTTKKSENGKRRNRNQNPDRGQS